MGIADQNWIAESKSPTLALRQLWHSGPLFWTARAGMIRPSHFDTIESVGLPRNIKRWWRSLSTAWPRMKPLTSTSWALRLSADWWMKRRHFYWWTTIFLGQWRQEGHTLLERVWSPQFKIVKWWICEQCLSRSLLVDLWRGHKGTILPNINKGWS